MPFSRQDRSSERADDEAESLKFVREISGDLETPPDESDKDFANAPVGDFDILSNKPLRNKRLLERAM